MVWRRWVTLDSNCLCDALSLLDSLWDALSRGVFFDFGCVMGSFSLPFILRGIWPEATPSLKFSARGKARSASDFPKSTGRSPLCRPSTYTIEAWDSLHRIGNILRNRLSNFHRAVIAQIGVKYISVTCPLQLNLNSCHRSALVEISKRSQRLPALPIHFYRPFFKSANYVMLQQPISAFNGDGPYPHLRCSCMVEEKKKINSLSTRDCLKVCQFLLYLT